MSAYVYDCETLPNYTLFVFRNVSTGEWFSISRDQPNAPERMKEFLSGVAVLIGFNNINFDDVILQAFCHGKTEAEMKEIANAIIERRMRPWQAIKAFGINRMRLNTVDLIEVAPLTASLKAYGARLHMPTIQDMPLHHETEVNDEQKAEIVEYCRNDVETTEALFQELRSEIALRVEMSKQYGIDLRSKSDSQMAEQMFISALGIKRTYDDPVIPKTICYTPPEFLQFNYPHLQELKDRVAAHVFDMNPRTGHVILPDFLGKDTYTSKTGYYQLGVGGIHSKHDKSVCYLSEQEIIEDIDAASFYPSIIINCGFVPERLGARFLDVYADIRERRLQAKAEGDKAVNESLKIALNGTFGKLASKWSALYSPDLMLAVTLTGQLTLLMLIEWLEAIGVEILSANTDGIAVRYPPMLKEAVRATVKEFENKTGFDFEYTQYRCLAMKDVNNYYAVKENREVKIKGIYSPLSLRKNPTAQVTSDAVSAWLALGIPFMSTIRKAPFRDFLSARNVTGGGEQGGVFLGKVVRWYNSTESCEPIRYIKNGNKVAKTDGARACMVFDPAEEGHPANLDYEWYHREAIKIAAAVGCAEYLTPEQQETLPKKRRKKGE